MKKLIALTLIGLLFSCEKKDDSPKNEISVLTTLSGKSGLSYSESIEKWNDLKIKNGNSYIYQTTFTSWTGLGSITELKVIDGIVICRIYQKFKTSETNGSLEIIDSYTEIKTNLGSHEKGAKPLTIDDLYNSCASNYLEVDKENNTIYFETETDGLMTLCGFVPDGCMDDCYFGVRINSFKWID
jgi:hypothetical protein